MRKTKFIMLALVVALVLMGAGYAAWTQAFTVQSTVTTGELNVNATETHTITVLAATGNYVDATPANSPNLNISGIVPAQPTVVNNASTLVYNLSTIYPGTRLTSTVTFTNTGTIETKMGYNADLSSVTGFGTPLFQDLVITVGNQIVPHGSSADEAKKNIAAAIANAVGNIPAGGTKGIVITQELPITSTNSTEKATMGWTASLSFEQFNNTSAATVPASGQQ